MNQTQQERTSIDKINFWVVISIVPVSFLAIAEYLPRAVVPINPTYLKYFGAQSILVIAIFLRLFMQPREPNPHRLNTKNDQLKHAFPVLLLLFGAWNLISMTWATWAFGATSEVIYSVTYLALAFVFYLSLQSSRRWMVFAKVFLISVAIAATWQLQIALRTAFSDDRLTVARAFLNRPLMFGNINFSCSSVITGALLAVAFLIVSIQSILRATKRNTTAISIAQILAYLAVLTVFCALLYFSSSLAGYIAAVVAVVAYILCMLPWPRIRTTLTCLLTFTCVTAVVVILYVPQYRRGVMRWALKRGTTTRARMVWWTAAGDMFAERPVLGWGAGSYGSVYYRFSPPISDKGPPTRGVAATHPHNEFLRIGAELGSAGLILYFLIFLVTLVTSYRSLRTAPFRHRVIGFAAWAGFFAYLTQAALGKGIQIWDMALPFWILSGALAATHRWYDAPGHASHTRPLHQYLPLFIAPALILWWLVGGLSGYRSMIHLKEAYNRVDALAGFARKNQSRKRNHRVRATAKQVSREVNTLLRSCHPYCPVSTLPLRLRYTLGINMASMDINSRACSEFRKVHSMAPGFLQVEKFLARCEMRNGNKKKARNLLLSFLDHHPTRLDAYIMLARIDLRTAAQRLARQVLERDALSNPRRTATLAQMMTVLQRWKDLRRLLKLVRQHASTKTYKLVGQKISHTCKQAGHEDKLTQLREDFPGAFESAKSQ